MVKKTAQTLGLEDNNGEDSLILIRKRNAECKDDECTPKRIKTKSLYKQPTVRELTRLNEAETLFNSNLFRLQVEEILHEVKVKEKTEKKILEWFQQFSKQLISIPANDKEYDLSDNSLYKDLKVKSPVGSILKKTKCSFKFHKFEKVEIIGSYSLGCAINSKLVIDLQISVPSQTYTKNDSVNYRYHKKRAAYLAYIASHLKSFESIEDLQYAWLHDCETKPYLEFKPTGKVGNYVTVRIHLSCEEDAYKLQRFAPARNNLRESWLFSTEAPENEVGPPTAYYNCSVLSDLTAAVNQSLLTQVLSNNENLKEAIVLLKIWLRQRNLQVSGYIVSLLVAHLVQIKRINNVMSSYQIVRNVWMVLKTSEWDTKGISLHKGEESPRIEEFLANFPVVFLDVTGYYNVCWRMCKGTYETLKRESALAIDMLDNTKINSFIPLFMTTYDIYTHFDHILKFRSTHEVINAVYEMATKETKLHFGTDRLALVTDALHTLLSKGLGNRVHVITELVEADFKCPVKCNVDKAKRECNFAPKLSFGFVINTENAMNVVDKGPAANLPEAEAFREFWGDKSELRRFQDGSITETCVWEADSVEERRYINKQVVLYLLNYKYGISSAFYIGPQLSSVLVPRSLPAAVQVTQVLEELRSKLRDVALPIDVAAVHGTSPVFSGSSPLPAHGLPAHPAPPAPRNPRRRNNAELIKEKAGVRAGEGYVPACHAVVELGHSGKWPGDLQALRCLKAAFHLQLGEALSKQYELPTHAYPTHVDVLMSGLVFRLQISCGKEIKLLRREMENGVTKYRDTDESVKLTMDTVLVPRLRGVLNGLHHKHTAFSPTAILFKRWLSCHLVDSSHFPPTVAELIVASIFVNWSDTPQSPLSGFMRVLRLMETTDWSTDMIVLDFTDEMTPEDKATLERQFTTSRSTLPALHIVTSLDGDLPGIWTKNGPEARILARVRMLAKSTKEYVEKKLEACEENLLGAFVPSLTGYNVLIHLCPHHVPYVGERVDKPATTVGVGETGDTIPVVEFNPVRKYLEELRSAYSEFALFFHDEIGGEVIGVLWKPEVRDLKDFQVSTANATVPILTTQEKKYKVNTSAIVEDFRILGQGLVKDIVVNM